LLQSEYRIGRNASASDIAWVVPVPDEPVVGLLPPRRASTLFLELTNATYPYVVYPSFTGSDILIIGLFLLGIGGLLVSLVSSVSGWPRWVRDRRRRIVLGSFAALFLVFLKLMSLTFGSGVESGPGGVEILSHEQVGVYDVHVITSTDAGALLRWLRDGGFAYDEENEGAFRDYVEKGWCFVTARIGRDSDAPRDRLVGDGLVAPLVLSSSSRVPIYPLALTATAGRSTELLLYVAGGTKVDCGNRLRTAFANTVRWWPVSSVEDGITPSDFPLPDALERPYLTKFTGTLEPTEMKDDLVFFPAPDNQPVRDTVYAE